MRTVICDLTGSGEQTFQIWAMDGGDRGPMLDFFVEDELAALSLDEVREVYRVLGEWLEEVGG